jgi:hypothetical protein
MELVEICIDIVKKDENSETWRRRKKRSEVPRLLSGVLNAI